MIVRNGVASWPVASGPVVATMGNYDGVHLGHRAIVRGVVDEARRLDATAVLVTFEPHPLAIVAPERRPPRIQTRRQRLAALEALDLDEVRVVDFDRRLASLDGEAFFAEVLLPGLSLASVHVGREFRFGKGRGDDVRALEEIGRKHGFRVVGVPHVLLDGETVSSSAVRAAVGEGDVERARRLLGRPFALEGLVVRGDGRGQRMDFPTANLDVENELLPRRGVYVTEAAVGGERVPSVSNVGVRPTFGGTALTVESHLLDWSGALRGERLELRFLARLRDERAFSSGEELADQIARDRAAASAWFQLQAAIR
jgi:riboflavin kinase/FMN adenylyltransferase